MLQIHHTWRPDYSNFTGSNHMRLQESMKTFHTNPVNKGGRGFSDIAQHLTLFPDGKWVTGRSFEAIPASIANHNTGAFAIEMLGNFDSGHDTMTGAQHKAIIEVSNYLVTHYKLRIVFHRDYAPKTCPGSSIDKASFINDVNNFRHA